MPTPPSLAPRSPLPGLLVVWVVAAVIGIAIGVFSPNAQQAMWLCVGLGGCLILAFTVEIFEGRAHGSVVRIAGSVLGALAVMGVISAGFGLASLGGA